MAKSKTQQENSILKCLPEKLRSKVSYLSNVDMYIIEIDPKTLNDNPKNWRIHPRRQRATYSAFKEKFGWLGFVIYNLKTKRLIDGHMRVDEAIKNKESFVPVILKYLDEDAEDQILASFDNIGIMAKRNNDALQNLISATSEAIGKAKSKGDQVLKQLTEDLKSSTDSILLPQSKTKVRVTKEELEEPDEDEEEEIEDSYHPPEQEPIHEEVINSDVLFPGLTDLGIPELLHDKLLPANLAPTRTYLRNDDYGSDAFFTISSGPFEEGQEIGLLGFYDEDYRFEDAYSNASNFGEYLKHLDPVGVCTPDFSTYSDWPMTLRMYSLYRSRWCGRFWQELGFYIVPSIQALGHPNITGEYAIETLPDEPPVLAIQCRKSDIEGLTNFIKQIVHYQRKTPEILLLYGGEVKQKYLHGSLPRKVGKKTIEYRYLPDYVEKSRRLRKKGRI